MLWEKIYNDEKNKCVVRACKESQGQEQEDGF